MKKHKLLLHTPLILRVLLLPLTILISVGAYSQTNYGAYASALNLFINGTTQYYNNSTTTKTTYTDQEHAINQGGGDWTSVAITQYATSGSNSIGTASINSGQLKLTGAKVKTYKTGLGNNCTVTLRYKQYRSTATAGAIAALPWNDLPLSLDGSSWNGLANPLGAFSDGDGVCDEAGYEKWTATTNLDLTTQTSEGDYFLEFFYVITGSDAGGCASSYNLKATLTRNFRAKFTIRPTVVYNTAPYVTNPTTCGGNGTIKLKTTGIAAGNYSNEFSCDELSPIPNVVVAGNIATVSLPAGTYSNINYQNNTACPSCDATPSLSPASVLTDPTPPVAPTATATAQPTCTVATGSITVTAPTAVGMMYSIDGTDYSNTSGLFTGVATGTYSVTCKDATTLCVSSSTSVTINAQPPTPLAPTGATPQTFCSADAPTVGDLVVVGTSIQWYTQASGGVSIPSNTPLVDGIHYFASQTNVQTCESTDRLDVQAIVNATPAAPTGIAAQSFCAGDAPTVASLSATGTAIQWYANSSGGAPLASNTLLGDGTHYYATQTVNGCESTNRFDVTVSLTIYPAPTGASPQTFCTFDAPKLATISVTGTAIKWYAAAVGGVALDPNTALSNGVHYYASQTIAGCESAARLDVLISLTDPVPPTGTSPQDFCLVNNPKISNLSTNTGSAIKWYAAASGGAPLAAGIGLVDGTHYYASQTVGGCESTTRLDVVANVADPLPPTGNAAQTFCVIANPKVSDIVVVGSTIKWYDAPTNGNIVLGTTNLVNGVSYYASQTVLGCESSTRLAVTVTLENTAAPSGSASQSFCLINNPTVANLTATGTAIQWYSAPLGGLPLAAGTALVDGNHYYATQTENGCESATRFNVTVTVTDPAPPSGLGNQTFCAKNAPTVADLSASGTSISWYSTSTGGAPLALGTSLVNATHYYASDNTGCESSTRLDVLVTVSDPVAPTANSPQNFCMINNPKISNLSTNTGSAIKWYAASSGGGALAAGTALVDGNHYYASQTVGGCESTSRVDVLVSVANPAAPTGAGAQSFCAIQNPTIADLTATGTAIQWYAASSGGVPLASGVSVLDGITYYATQTVAGCESATRYALTVTIASPPAPTGLASQTLCAIDNPKVSNLSATGTNIQWYSTSSGGAPLAVGTALINGNHYYASQTIGVCESDTRLDVTVTIDDPAAPTGSANQTLCTLSNPTVSNLSATGSNIKWYAASSGGVALLSTVPLVDGNHYYATQTVSGCESDTRFDVTVSLANPAAPTGSASQTFCAVASPVINDLTATGSNIQWYTASSGGVPLLGTTSLVNATHYYASQTVGGCESTSRFDVTVTIDDPIAPTANANQTFCSNVLPTVANLSTTSGVAIKWYRFATGGVQLLLTDVLVTGNYYASQTVAGCESSNRVLVSVIVNDPLPPTGAANQILCTGDNPTINSINVVGSNVKWYDQAVAGTLLAGGTSLIDGTTYYASQTVAGCESVNRLAVTVDINPTPGAPTGNAAQSFCLATNPQIANLSIVGGTPVWYSANVGGTQYLSTDALINGNTYYAAQIVNGCESKLRFAVNVTINDTPPPTGNALQNFCSVNDPTLSDIVITATALQWYDAPIGGNLLPVGTALVNGQTYHASQTIGCESSVRKAVTVTVNDPAPPSGSANQTFCSIDNPTVGDIAVTGTSVLWYDQPVGGSVVNNSDALQDGFTYYATQNLTSCESKLRLAVTVTVLNPAAPTGSQNQKFCSINNPTIANLSLNEPVLKWYDAPNGGNLLPSNTPLVTATTYYATQVSGSCESVGRLSVSVIIDDPAAPTGNTAPYFCSITNPKVSDILLNEGNLTWYDAAVGGSIVPPTTALVNGTTYFATQTVGGCESINRLGVTVAVGDPVAPTGNASQTLCVIDNPTVSNIVTTSGLGIQWYDAPTFGNLLPSNTPVVNGTSYYATQTVLGCESKNRLAVLVNTSNPAAPTAQSLQAFCNVVAPKLSDISITGSGIKWYDAPVGGAFLPNNTPLVDGQTYFASQTVAGCEGTFTTGVTVMLGKPATPTANSPQTFCLISNPTISSLTTISGMGVKWYDAPVGGNLLGSGTSITNGSTYYAVSSVTGCESDVRLAVNVIVNDPGAPTGLAAQTFCAIDNKLVSDIAVTGTSIVWYDAPNFGNVVNPTDTLMDGITYYASQNPSGCESASRLAVAVTVSDPSAPTGTANQTFCTINNPSLNDVKLNEPILKWYSLAVGGVLLPNNTPLVPGTTYFAAQVAGGCESILRYGVTVSLTDPAPPTGLASQQFCSVDNPDVSDLVASGTAIKWYDAPVGGNLLLSTSSLVNGTNYYASQTIGGCESSLRLAVAVTINPIVLAPIIGPITHASCATPTGSVDLSGLPTGAWTLTGSPGGVVVSGSGVNATIPNIPPGTYTVTVTDDVTKCTSVSSNPLTINPNLTTPATPILDSITQIKCGGNTGKVHLSNLPGSWTLFMNPGAVSTTGVGSSTTIPNLAPGTYNFAVRNESTGCVSMATADITINPIPSPPSAPVIGAIVHPSCSVPAGSVDLSGLPATGNWQVTSNPGGLMKSGTGSTTTFTGLGAGSYTFTVTVLSTACTSPASSAAVLLPDPNTPATPAIGKVTQPDCLVNTGSIDLNSLPSGNWTLTMNPGNISTSGTGTTYTVSNLPAGTYTFNVKNESTGCLSLTTSNLVINPVPSPPSAPTISKVDQPSCLLPGGVVTFSGLPSGSWTLNRLPDNITTAGTGSTASIMNIPAGTYTYTVTDGLTNCTSIPSTSVSISPNPNAIAIPTVDSIIHPKCTLSTGKISFSGLPSGAWTLTQSPGAITITGTGNKFSVSSLVPGVYSFIVKDESTGCVSLSTSNLTINPLPTVPAAPVVVKVTQPSCLVAGGIVDVSGLPAVDPWIITRKPDNFTFSGKGPNTSLVNLPGGTFTFTVTNVTSQCTSTESASVVITPNLSTPSTPVGIITQPTCASTKAIIALSNLPSGSWTLTMRPGNITNSGSGSNFSVSNLDPGKYTFVVRNDANSCMSLWTDTLIVNPIPSSPVPPTANIQQPSALSPFGQIDFNVQTGMEYSIGSGYKASPTFVNVLPGSYTLSVRNLLDSTCFAVSTTKVDIIGAGPIAMPDSASLNQNDTLRFTVTKNDAFGSYLPEGVIQISMLPTHGSVTVNDNNTPNDPTDDIIQYVPDVDYFGLDTLEYTVCSKNNLCSTAKVTLTINSLASLVSVLKKASVPMLRKDGTYGIIYTIIVTNKTANPVRKVQVEDDLTKTFVSPMKFTVEAVTTGSKLTASQLYDGKIELKSLVGADALQGYETDSVRIKIQIITGGFSGTISNQALMSGYSDSNGPIRKFKSDNGTFGIVPQPTTTEIKSIFFNANNGFTPNGDGFNDTYVVMHSEELRVDITIFNRWGSLVYESKDYKNDWNGKGIGIYTDQDMPTGTYYYVVRLYNEQNALLNEFKGYLTLKR